MVQFRPAEVWVCHCLRSKLAKRHRGLLQAESPSKGKQTTYFYTKQISENSYIISSVYCCLCKYEVRW
jgi:hypothetical protein